MGRQSGPNNGRQHVQKKHTTTEKVYSAQEEFPPTITNKEKLEADKIRVILITTWFRIGCLSISHPKTYTLHYINFHFICSCARIYINHFTTKSMNWECLKSVC